LIGGNGRPRGSTHTSSCSSKFEFFLVDSKQYLNEIFCQIRGKDLPGAVNVLPAGLSEVLAKRESREINFEVKYQN